MNPFAKRSGKIVPATIVANPKLSDVDNTTSMVMAYPVGVGKAGAMSRFTKRSGDGIGDAALQGNAGRSRSLSDVDPTVFNPIGGGTPVAVVPWNIEHTTPPSGILVIIGMPPGGDLRIDGTPIYHEDTSASGYALGWVGGNPALGTYVIDRVPVGAKSIEITSDGVTKTWPAQAIVETTFPARFDMATGRAPAGSTVNTIDWTRQPVASAAETHLPDFTITLTPTTATTTAGEDISQVYQITTATTGNGTVLNLALSVASADLIVAGGRTALDKTTLRSGESATLTLTGSKDIPPGSISFTVTATGGTAPSVLAKNVTGTLVVPEKVVDENTDEEGGISTPVIIGGVALLALGAFVVLRMTRKPKAAPRDNPGKKRRRRALARR